MKAQSALAALVLTATPAAAAPRPVHRMDLPAGAKALLVEDHSLQLVNVGVTLRVGAAADPPGKEGLARITAEMLLRGAAERTREQIEETIDGLGSTLEVDAGHSSLSLDGDALTRNLDAFLGLLADVLLRPTFPPDELARLVRETQADIRNERDDDRALAGRFFRRELFRDHPYGRPAIGTIASVGALTVEDVKAFYAHHFVGPNLILSAAGDVTPEAFQAAVSAHFGSLPAGEVSAPEVGPAPRPTGRRVVLVDKPERTQTQILIGHEGIPASHPDSYALDVVNTAFGGTFTARLMQEIRVKHGWSYGAYSRVGSDRDAGSLYMWIFPSTATAVAATQRTIELYEALIRDGLTEAELEFARGYLVNTLAFSTDTAAKLADELVRGEVLGLPADYLETYPERIGAVTTEDARRAITAHMHADDLLITILCTAEDLATDVPKIPGVATPPVLLPYDSD